MPDILSDHPVTDLVPEGRHGWREGVPGVFVQAVSGLALATVAARKGATGRVQRAVEATFGFPLADAPKVSFGPELSLIGTAPGRWLAAANAAPESLVSRLSSALGETATLTDQSDANLIVDAYGPHISEALVKLVPIDLHPSAFAPGDAAATSGALIPLMFWQLNDSPAYRFAVPRSFAPSFVRALVSAGAEFGVEVTGTGRG